MSVFTTEQDEIQTFEPILAQKQVKLQLGFAESSEWTSKVDKNKYPAAKFTWGIIDKTVKTEHDDAQPRLTVVDQFNLLRFPYPDKKTGETKYVGRNALYQLEAALGFDPIFMAGDGIVEPHITKSGNKVAPKGDNVKRVVNPDFFNNYFNEEGVPNMDNWFDKVIYADIGVEHSEQYGSKNIIKRYVKAPVI